LAAIDLQTGAETMIAHDAPSPVPPGGEVRCPLIDGWQRHDMQATSDIVLQCLIDEWQVCLPNLAQYLKDTFGYDVARPLRVDRLFISQPADGNMATRNIGSMADAKWVVRGSVVERVPTNYASREVWLTDESGILYRSPSYLYFSAGGEVLLSEHFGHNMLHRRSGKLIGGTTPRIDWSTLWLIAHDEKLSRPPGM
jgi:hypothetical protein